MFLWGHPKDCFFFERRFLFYDISTTNIQKIAFLFDRCEAVLKVAERQMFGISSNRIWMFLEKEKIYLYLDY